MAGGVTFCPVCREEIVRRIYRYVDSIDGCQPAPSKILIGRGKFKFSVDLVTPLCSDASNRRDPEEEHCHSCCEQSDHEQAGFSGDVQPWIPRLVLRGHLIQA